MSTQPPLTEHNILSSYLLNPAPLPQIISYSEFVKTCVPTQHKDNPLVKRLYRDLQFQRDIDVDSVRQNIERECRRAGILRGRLAAKIAIENNNANQTSKKRKRSSPSASAVEQRDHDNTDDENELDVADTMYAADLHPAESMKVKTKATPPPAVRSHTGHGHNHTTSSLLDAMEAAIVALKREDSDLELQSSRLVKDIRETIGQLSDLRYGRFARSGNGADEQESFEETLVSALNTLETAAKRATDGMS